MRTTSKKNVKRGQIVKTRRAEKLGDMLAKAIDTNEKAALAQRTNSPIPFLPPMDMEHFRSRVIDAERKDDERSVAQSHRVYDAVLLMLNNPNHIEMWANRWEHVSGKDKAAKDDANAWFDADFAMDDPTNLKPDEKLRWSARRRLFMRSVQFCVVLRRAGLMRAFEFNELGGCFLLTASTLGQKIAKKEGWLDSDAFKKSGRNIQMVDRRTRNEGNISWMELENVVLKKDETSDASGTDAVDKSDIDGSAIKRVTVDMEKPFAVMAKAHAELAGRETFTSTEHHQAMERMDAIVGTVFKAQAFAENVALYLVFSKAMRAQLNMPVSKLATGTGKQMSQPIKGIDPNVKRDVVTPETVKALPLAKLPPARVVTAEELKAHRAAKAKRDAKTARGKATTKRR